MADDVIVAGPPEPAEPQPHLPVAAAVSEKQARRIGRAERARGTAYRFRFGLVYFVLAGIVGGAVGSFVVVATRPGDPPAPDWSSWQPDGSNDARAKQIADHVSTRYRLPSGNQLAIAIAGPPSATASDGTSVPVEAIAVRPDTSTGQAEEDDIEIVRSGDSLMFVLCGLGDRCSITEGEASEERHQLLRREALELALYTFKYVDSTDSVVVFLPPRPDADVSTSVFLTRSDVADELHRPLSKTLVSTVPPQLGAIPAQELGNIDRLTRPRLYEYGFTQAQNGSGILVLDPIVAG